MPNRAQRRAAVRQTFQPNTSVEIEPGSVSDPKGHVSEAQLAANRANAQQSTGPKSESGRAASSQNHTSHGLARHNGTFVLLPSEDPNGFEFLKAALGAEHQPTSETESILVTTMAESHWLANRAQNLQNGCFDQQTSQITDTKMFSLYLRYQTTHTRAFHKSLNDLLKIRAEKSKEKNGFEAQERREAELRMKIGEYEMKRQVENEQQAFQNPEFRADMIRWGLASVKKGPEYEALNAEIRAKWFTKEEESEAAAA